MCLWVSLLYMCQAKIIPNWTRSHINVFSQGIQPHKRDIDATALKKKYFTSIDVTFSENQAYYFCNLSQGESPCDSNFKNQFFSLNGLNFNNVNSGLNLEVSNPISNSEISNKETDFWEFFQDPCPQNMKHFKEVLNSKLQ